MITNGEPLYSSLYINLWFWNTLTIYGADYGMIALDSGYSYQVNEHQLISPTPGTYRTWTQEHQLIMNTAGIVAKHGHVNISRRETQKVFLSNLITISADKNNKKKNNDLLHTGNTKQYHKTLKHLSKQFD